ncbi:MAG: monovalent cation/H+ antiporter subunit D [Hyphomicrobiaceae bacterium]|nr:monovalent cation/H+ antiporter subunit D [Hyphomicrobiaceae bacterium]
MSHVLLLPILLPLLAAVVCVAGQKRGLAFQRPVSLAATVALPLVAAVLVASAAQGEISSYAMGAWPAPFGIVLVLDRLSAAMVMLTSVLALPALIYSLAGADAKGRSFHALFQFQLAGLNGAFLTGDIFNLFVFFEVLLGASYGLLAHGGGLLRARASITYIVLNLAGSTLFLIALAFIYGTLGTLNIADLARVLPQVPPSDQALVRTAFALLVIVFALKAALLPLSFWLPLAYGAAIAPVAALFAVLTKVGIYALLRISGIVLNSAEFTVSLFDPWLVPVAITTIAVGAIGVLAAPRLSVVVAYLVVVSTGTLLSVITVLDTASTAAVIYYMLHSTLATGGFFLLADAIANQRGDRGDKLERGPHVRDLKVLGSAFLVLAVAVSGMPPLSGFLGKVMLMQAVQSSEWVEAIWPALLVSSLVVGLALARQVSVLFWEPIADEPRPVYPPPSRLRATAVVALVAASPILTLATGSVSAYARAAAEQLVARQGYIDAVLGTTPQIIRERRPR